MATSSDLQRHMRARMDRLPSQLYQSVDNLLDDVQERGDGLCADGIKAVLAGVLAALAEGCVFVSRSANGTIRTSTDAANKGAELFSRVAPDIRRALDEATDAFAAQFTEETEKAVTAAKASGFEISAALFAAISEISSEHLPFATAKRLANAVVDGHGYYCADFYSK